MSGIPGLLEVPAFLSIGLAMLYTAYRRIVQAGGEGGVSIYLVRRFHFPQLGYTYAGRENRVKVGSVRLDDPEFDERMVELRFKADETRRRLAAIR